MVVRWDRCLGPIWPRRSRSSATNSAPSDAAERRHDGFMRAESPTAQADAWMTLAQVLKQTRRSDAAKPHERHWVCTSARATGQPLRALRPLSRLAHDARALDLGFSQLTRPLRSLIAVRLVGIRPSTLLVRTPTYQ